MEGQGLGALVNADAGPVLEGLAGAAVHAWQWCGGWRPEALPLYLALYPCEDVHGLTDRLMVLRDNCGTG